MARLLFFGKLRDVAGGRAREIILPDSIATVPELIAMLEATDPILAGALRDRSVRIVVNEQITSSDGEIGNQDEIAFLPPVSGG